MHQLAKVQCPENSNGISTVLGCVCNKVGRGSAALLKLESCGAAAGRISSICEGDML